MTEYINLVKFLRRQLQTFQRVMMLRITKPATAWKYQPINSSSELKIIIILVGNRIVWASFSFSYLFAILDTDLLKMKGEEE